MPVCTPDESPHESSISVVPGLRPRKRPPRRLEPLAKRLTRQLSRQIRTEANRLRVELQRSRHRPKVAGLDLPLLRRYAGRVAAAEQDRQSPVFIFFRDHRPRRAVDPAPLRRTETVDRNGVTTSKSPRRGEGGHGAVPI